MGIQTAEEIHDSTYDMELATGGGYQVTMDEIRRNGPDGTEAEAPATDRKPCPGKAAVRKAHARGRARSSGRRS